jgi:hypothetical protein
MKLDGKFDLEAFTIYTSLGLILLIQVLIILAGCGIIK